ncbi:MAG: hypothetical protein OXI16_02985 [Chloroflexota bacterium]|nr:hypothetical protein [Chloroflexota bacterium]
MSRLRIDPRASEFTIVFLGQFNPAIFSPAWFGWHELLPAATVEAAELQAAQPRVMSFRAEWLELLVTPDRFMVQTTQSPSVRIKDLVLRTFVEQLPHTPIQAMGINRNVQFLVGDFKERDRIGRRLAPTEPWGEWGSELDPDGSRGGMASLTMRQVNIPDRPRGDQINVTVGPWDEVPDGRGVTVQANDHHTHIMIPMARLPHGSS